MRILRRIFPSARRARLVAVALLAGAVTAGGGPFTPAPRTQPRTTEPAEAVADAVRPTTRLASSVRFHAALTDSVARNAHDQAASRAVSLPVLGWPAEGALTGWWGEHRGSHVHAGIDVDGEVGDPIWAAGAGEVVHAGWAPAEYSGYGLMVLIDHGHAVQTLYAHLDTISVVPGQWVNARQLIGTMGVTGNVTGSHLHFEVRRLGVPVDPRPWLPG